MKILILGIDGYLGWPTALRMVKKDHRVFCIDNLSERTQLRKNKVISAFKINDIKKRITNLKKYQKNIPVFFEASVTERTKLNHNFKNYLHFVLGLIEFV